MLDNHAPIKKKSVRANDGPFMTKTFRKPKANRTRLRNIYCKDRTADNLKAFKKKRNKSVNILRQAKEDLDIKDLTDNRNFWKSVKPLFNDKVKPSSTIVLVENEKIVSEDRAVADILNEYFSTITESLNIAGSNENQLPVVGISDPVTAAIEKYCYHPSILLIKGRYRSAEACCFKKVTISEISEQVDNLDTKKATAIDSILAKGIKDNVDIVA